MIIQIIQYGPRITLGNVAFVYHCSVFACFHPNPHLLEQYIHNEGSDCTDSANMPKDFVHCFNPYFLWVVGGGFITLPNDIGIPLGDEPPPTFLMLNIHYDNPEQIEGVIDSSGLEFYYTKNYRKYEASTLSFGSALDNRMFVPPKQPNFHISGHCLMDCFQNVNT